MKSVRTGSINGVVVQSVIIGVICNFVVCVGEIALRRIDDLQAMVRRNKAKPIMLSG